MKNIIKICLLLAAAFFLFSGCQTVPLKCQTSNAFLNSSVENLDLRLKSGLYLQKIDNLIFLVDDTLSMTECFNNTQKREYGKNQLNRIIRTIPSVELTSALRGYGPNADTSAYQTLFIHGLSRLNSDTLEPTALTKTFETTLLHPMAYGLEGIYHELKLVKGNSAIIIISDFNDIGIETVNSATLLKNYYQERISIYPLVIGNNDLAVNSAEDIVLAVGSGTTVTVDRLNSATDLANYVENILFVKMKKPEPILPPIAKQKEIIEEPQKVQPLSYKKLLKERKLSIELKTEFDFDKYAVRKEYLSHLQEIATFMKEHPDTKTTIEGHTCSTGTETYNKLLSQQRAESVKQHLVDKFGIESYRLDTASYGETKPIADNSTAEGRKKNRRAVAIITTILE